MKTPVSIGWTVIRKNAVSTLLKERMAKNVLPLSLNFSDEDQEGYELPITDAKELEVILASDDVTFGGSKKYTKKKVKVTDGKAVLDLSAYSAVYYSIAV